MGKYDDLIGGFKVQVDVEEVLNEVAADKVDQRIKKQKTELEKPIKVNLDSDAAINQLNELTKAAKKVKDDLKDAISSGKEFKDLHKAVVQYEQINKQIKQLAPAVGKNNSALKESNKILRDTKKLVDQLMGVEKKPRKPKSKVSVQQEVEATKDLISATEDIAKAQEKVAKTTLRTQKQVNAELDKELKKLKDIEAQQTKNDAAREKLKRDRANYGKEFLGTDRAVYDTDLLKGARKELQELNQMLETRNKFQEKYIKLCNIISNYYVDDRPGKHSMGNGLYKNLDAFFLANSDISWLESLNEKGQKTTNKVINEAFKNIIRGLQADINTVSGLIRSGEVVGDMVGQNLDREETKLNREMQELGEAREAQLKKINALRQEELNLIKQAGQAEAENINKLKFSDGTLLDGSQVKAVEKYCAVLKKQMGETYNEAMALKGALDLVFDIKEGNIANLMDRFHNGNPASNAVLGLLTDMDVNNQKNRDAALRSINPDVYDQIIAEQKAAAEKAKAELKTQKSDFQKQWDEFVSAMLGGDAFEGESNLAKGRILKAFSEYGVTAAEAIHELNKAWLNGDLEGKSGKTKWVQAYINHLNDQREYIDSIRDAKAGDLDVDSLLGFGGTTGLSEEKAQALRNEAAAWDELIANKKEYYGLSQPSTVSQEANEHNSNAAAINNEADELERLNQLKKKGLQSDYISAKTYDRLVGNKTLQDLAEVSKSELLSFLGDNPSETESDLKLWASQLKENMAPVEDAVKRISKLATVSKELNVTDKLYLEIGRVGQQISTLYDEGITDTEEYIALQHKLLKMFDAIAKAYGGVKGSGAKDRFELNQWMYESLKQDTGFDYYDRSLIDGLYNTRLSIYDNDTGKKRSMRDMAADLLNYKSDLFDGAFGFEHDLQDLKAIQGILDVVDRHRLQLFGDGISSEKGTLEHLINSLSKLDSISPDPLNKIIESIVNGEEKISAEVQQILQDLNLLNDAGQFSGNFITEGMNNSGVVTNDKYAIISRGREVYDQYDDYDFNFKEGTTYLDNLIAKEKEAAEQGVNLARVLDVVKAKSESGGDLFYEIQEFAPGEQLHIFDAKKKNLQDFEQECARITNATDEQIQKLMSDIAKLNELGFFIDFSPANILYDAVEGFKLIDLELRDLGTSAQTTTDLMEGLFVCLMGLEDNVDRIGSDMADADKWGTSMASVYDRLNNAFAQNNFGVNIGDIASGFDDSFKKYISQTNEQTESNKKLQSSYEGLADAVETYVSSSKKLWEAYDKGGDFGKFAEERNAAIEKIASMFPNGEISSGTSAGMYLQSQEMSRIYASKGAEVALADIEGKLTRAKEEQARLSQEAEAAVLAQAEAEKTAAEAAEKTANAKKKQKDAAKNFANTLSDEILGDGDEDALKTIVNLADESVRMINIISSAAGKSAATKFLEGITSETDLQSRVSGYFNEVFNGDDWKFKEGKGSWSVKGNTYTANLVNGAQDALKAVFKLDDGVLKLQEDLLELKGANIVDNFDISAAIRQASADVRNLKADLGSIKYDGIGELEGLASSITSIEGVEKFKTALSAAKTEVAALKKEYAKGTNSLNDFSKASTVMRNAEVSIKSMRMDLEKLGNVDGVSKAEDALTRMTTAAENFNKAINETQQRDAWNSYNEAKTDFDAQYKYAQKTSKAQENQVGTVKNQYKSILDLVNKINTANERMIKFQKMDGGSGLLGKQMQTEIDKKAAAIEKLNAVMSELKIGDVLGKDQYAVSDDIQSIGTDYSQIAAFINDAGVQASLTTTEIEKLVSALVKAGDIDLSMLDEALNAGSIKERAKQIQKENQYFSDKTSVSIDSDGNTKLKVEEIQKLGAVSTTAKEKLESMAQAIAQNSEGAVALTKNFSMGADGIARLDFSIFDTKTGSIKDFTAALGTATGQMGVFETTVDKLAKSEQTALNQIQKSQNTLAKFGFGNVGLNDTNAPMQVTKVLEQVNALDAALKTKNETLITQCTKDLADATKGFEKAGNSAQKMKEAIESDSAIYLGDIDPNGDIYGQLAKEVQNYAVANGAATVEMGKFDKTTKTLDATLISANGTMSQVKVSMYGLNGECALQQAGVSKLTTSWDRFKSSMSKAGKQLVTAFAGYNVFYKAISEVRKGIGYVKEIDLALTELKKVTDETEESYRKFLNTAAGTAGEIGSTVSDFTEATANFARLGYTMNESAEMAKTAIVYKNVADGLDTVEESTDSIISTMKAFGIESNNTMGIVDRFNEVGNNFAITSAGIGEALQRSASALFAAGNTIDESIALVTAANSVIQNPEQVGELIAHQYSNILLENSYIG